MSKQLAGKQERDQLVGIRWTSLIQKHGQTLLSKVGSKLSYRPDNTFLFFQSISGGSLCVSPAVHGTSVVHNILKRHPAFRFGLCSLFLCATSLVCCAVISYVFTFPVSSNSRKEDLCCVVPPKQWSFAVCTLLFSVIKKWLRNICSLFIFVVKSLLQDLINGSLMMYHQMHARILHLKLAYFRTHEGHTFSFTYVYISMHARHYRSHGLLFKRYSFFLFQILLCNM